MLREQVERADAWDRIEAIPFFALPWDRRRAGSIPIFVVQQGGDQVLRRGPTSPGQEAALPLFQALPPTPSEPAEDSSSAMTPLYEYRTEDIGRVVYSTDSDLKDKNLTRSAEPICR